MQLHLKKSSLFTFKKLLYGRLSLSGRNNTGKLVNYHRGAGHKKVYRIIDFYRYIWGVQGMIMTFEYDPNRSSPISMVTYSNSVLCYILSLQNLQVSSIVMSNDPIFFLENRSGFCSNLKSIQPGSYIHNVETKNYRGSQYVRTAGNYSKLVSLTEDGFAILKLRSKFLFKIKETCVSTLGLLATWSSIFFLKRNAGFFRNLGWRPHVRGVAKNPVDHPHGGGQGKTSGGRPSVTPWSYITKGLKTRRKITYGTIVLKR